MLTNFLGKDFVQMSDNEPSCINKEILANINLKIPEEGEKIQKLVEVARERNINYVPSPEARMALNSYLDRKGIPNPLDANQLNQVDQAPPVYNPGQPVQPPPAQPPAYDPN